MARNFGWLLLIAAIVGGAAGAAFGAGRAYEARQVTPVAGAGAATAGGVVARTPLAGATGGQAAGQTGGQAVGQGGGQAGGAGRVTVGTVLKVEGTTLTVTTLDNQTVSVIVPADAPISRQSTVALGDLAIGNRVSVVAQGTPQAGGAIVAQSVAVVPDGPGGGRGAGQAGQGGGGPGRGAGNAPDAVPTPPSR